MRATLWAIGAALVMIGLVASNVSGLAAPSAPSYQLFMPEVYRTYQPGTPTTPTITPTATITPTMTSTATVTITPTATDTPTVTPTAIDTPTNTPTPTPTRAPDNSISTGYYHTCALTAGGGIKCWGYNGWGELGNGTGGPGTDSFAPVDVSGLPSDMTAVTTGSYHTCALTSAGGVKCWGANDLGQLGDDGTATSYLPMDVVGLTSRVIAISAGENHTCALTSAGGVMCWGANDNGQLGDGTSGVDQNRLTPVPVTGLSDVIAISAGENHTCALTSAGGVMCWGFNDSGQLGNNSTTDSSIPLGVSGLESGATAVSAGGGHTCALMTGGGVYCWGDNLVGQLGDGASGPDQNRLTPVPVTGLSGVAAISAGSYHTCAVTTGGGVNCWGGNLLGQLGSGAQTDSAVPLNVWDLTSGVTAMSAGYYHTCAITAAGGGTCWGWNSNGQIGDGIETTDPRLTPVAVVGL